MPLINDVNSLSNNPSENVHFDSFNTVDNCPIADRDYSLNYIHTNARSLRPKITSLIDAFENLDLSYAVVTETWFSNGNKLEKESEDLLLGHGLGALTLKRPPGRGGYSHGGVAVIYRDSTMKAKLFSFPNPSNFEVLPVQLSVRGINKKIFVIAIYMPPGYTVRRAKECFQHIKDLVLQIKDKFTDPYIALAGNFNQWKIEQALEDYQDIAENEGGHTRKNRTIDKGFTNWHDLLVETLVLPHLETEEDERRVKKSDHNIVLTRARIPKLDPPNWQKYEVRTYTDKAAAAFKDCIELQSWQPVHQANSSNEKARRLKLFLDEGMNTFFPLKVVRRKENDKPWIDETTRTRIAKKKQSINQKGKVHASRQLSSC